LSEKYVAQKVAFSFLKLYYRHVKLGGLFQEVVQESL